VFLYTELAAYVVACLNALANTADVEVHVVRWPINKEAPFQFDIDKRIRLYERADLDQSALHSLLQKIDPAILFCSGWIDKGYVEAAKTMPKKCTTVLCLDNHWNGSIKQQAARVLAPFTIKKAFEKVWVPGAPQHAYARKLGYSEANIQEGFYCADTPLFESYYSKYKAAKSEALPHCFLYIGRYLPFKGIVDLWEAFARLQREHHTDWKLVCAGTGDLFEERMQHPDIEHLGFIQPQEMDELIGRTGVFVLPSHKEPWAVTVHEFAAAGFPLICSEAVGATATFLNSAENGYTYQAGDREALYQKMLNFVQNSDAQLVEMAEKSHAIGAAYTPQDWVSRLLNFLDK